MSENSTELPPALRACLAADPLWDAALALYTRPGVEEACLHLQDDAGVEVVELLWRSWLYRHGLSAGPLPEPVRDWQYRVTTPLRRLRRELKAEAQARASVAALRTRLQAVELEAEREALSRLEAESLDGRGLSLLSRPLPSLENVLTSALQVQKKSHFIALQTLESRLDPSWAPR